MRGDRLLSILLILQGQRRTTARALAEQLEVSERTIYRDLDALSLAGVPVVAQQGRGGGVQLLAHYRTDLTGLTEREARAVLVSGVPEPLADLGLGEDVAGARRKLLAALPEPNRASAEGAAQRIHLDPGRWFQMPEDTQHLGLLLEAIWRQRKLRLHYRAADGKQTRREIEPLGLVAKAGTWYLVAQTARGDRVFRVARIRSLSLLEDEFARPPDFDLAAFWRRASAEFESGVPRFAARLRVRRDSIPTLPGHAGELLRGRVAARESEDGAFLETELCFDHFEDARAGVLALGAAATVVEPAELRDAVLETCRAVLDANAASGDAPRLLHSSSRHDARGKHVLK